jgi:hypothetical protein
MDPFDRHRAAPAVLAERERQFADLARQVVDLTAVTGAAFDPAVAAWEGIAAPELRAAPRPVRDRAHAVASQLAWAATATRVWAAHVRAFNATVDTLRAERAAVPAEVERSLPAWASLPMIDQDLVRERRREELVHDLHRRWQLAYEEHIEAGSREVAGLLERGPTWENLALARLRGGLAAGSRVGRLFAAGWLAAAAPTEALRLAGRFTDPAQPPTAGELAQLHDLLEQYAADPEFWYRFLTGLRPERLLTVTGQVALHLPDHPPAGLGELVGGIQAMLGAGLALAAARRGSAPPGGRDRPAGPGLSPEWLAELVTAGRRRFEIVTARAGSPVTVRLYGYQLLGPLLGAARYDRRFLQVVGGDLVDFEMAAGGARRWSGWLTGLGVHAESMRLDWTGPGPGQPAGFDPVLGLIGALDRRPAGALDLLAGRVQPGGGRLPRLDYLLTDRDWPPAWTSHHQSLAYLAGHPGATDPSPGLARFGEVLAKLARLADPRAVRVVELIVSEINVDEQAMGYPDRAVPGEAWTRTTGAAGNDLVSPVLREPLAGIVADYIIDVNAAVRDSGSALPGGLGADFDPTQLIRFLADLGRSRPAHETVLAAQTAYAAAAYHFYLSGAADLRPDSLPDRLAAATGVARAYGTVSGALDLGAATADWYEQWQRDLAANRRVADGFTVAELVVGAGADLLSARAPGAGFAAGELTSQVLAGFRADLLVDHSGLSAYRNAVLFGDGRRVAASLAEAALYRSGQLAGLAEFGLRDGDGSPTPMSSWDSQDRERWESYKSGPGAATAGLLPDRAGTAYQEGVDRARLIRSGALPDPADPPR